MSNRVLGRCVGIDASSDRRLACGEQQKRDGLFEAIPALGSASKMPVFLPGDGLVAMNRGKVRDKEDEEKTWN